MIYIALVSTYKVNFFPHNESTDQKQNYSFYEILQMHTSNVIKYGFLRAIGTTYLHK